MTRPVGFIFIEALLAPLCDPLEPVRSELLRVNGVDERQVREVIQKYVKPYYESFDERSKITIADSILYFASAKSLPMTTSLDALPTPFELAQEIHVLCGWLSTELRIGSKEFNLADCEYTDNLSFVHRLHRAVRPKLR